MARWRWIPPNEREIDGQAWIEIDGIAPEPNHGLNGPVYCPEGGYYDPVLNRRFESKQEKRDFMRANGLMMHSSNSPKKIEGQGRKTLYFYS